MTETIEEQGLAVAMVRLAHLVQHHFGEVSRAHGLTPQQAQLLCQLIDGPVGMADLGRRLHLEKSSLTGLVDRAERRGLVVRARDSRDRRACSIELTGEGSRLAVQTHQAVCEVLEATAAGVPVAEQERFTATAARIVGG
ncbi:MarR family winged helix-turn-helix transcriptional regulator [Saccharopolyspora indica]|uniref:MarR family winged helix-turn-helix transcriptional regulator n=1 Tax=Saccharopolyspora indica TaxID=1229659 RepID=UPI0022EAD397|nr:MarR family winged helix-turn-helix transcriptional regulator [Saccharopolyspora indica]MDA3646268.1 MarR family winged helix-turn-helix transcriptional regulator [Saccharopolyspora indica]